MTQFVRCGLTLRIWKLGRADFVFWLLLVAPSSLCATPQIPDNLRIGDTVAPLCMAPLLAPYFAQNPSRDVRNGKGGTYKSCEPERDTDGVLLEEYSTRLWRRYVASFAIVDGQLVVEQIWADGFGRDDAHRGAVIDCAMPEPESRYLDWFTGPLYYLRTDPVDDGDETERE